MTPAHLRAQAALWSLAAALDLLADRVIEDDRAIAAEHRAAAEPLRSPTYGTRTALGGHGDPTADALDTITAPRANRWIDLETEVDRQLLEVAQRLPGDGWWNPVKHMRSALPCMSERAAAATAGLADRLDGRIRRLLGEAGDRQLIPRVRCRECDTTGLVVRTAAPVDQRVVECTTCTGAWLWSEMVGAAA